MNNAIAIVFPGQGSQTVGMLKDTGENHPEFISDINRASDILNYDVWDLIQHGPAETLNQTEYTAPIMLCVSVALFQLIKKSYGENITVMAGHSLGEFTALTCAGCISFEDGLNIVRKRALLMQQAAPGSMAAIVGMDENTLADICYEVKIQTGAVDIANYNSPGQIVIAGETSAIVEAMELAKTQGAKLVKRLPVNGLSHCQLMKPASVAFQDVLTHYTFKPPKIPVVHNVNGQISKTENEIKQLLVEQLYKPVQWIKCIETINHMGIHSFLECGPGKILAGLIKRIHSQNNTLTLNNLTLN